MPQIQIFISEENKLTHDLSDEKVTVGRLADNTLQVDDASVSSRHAEIFLERDKYHLHDLGSTNGTFVNGEQVTDAVLQHGDEVRFGRIESVFTNEEEGGSSQPLPESLAANVQAASQSSRPTAFVSTSPVPKVVKEKNPLAPVLYGLTVLSILSAGAAAYFVFAMQATAA